MTTYTQLPAASALTGTEIVPLDQGGITSQSTMNAVKLYIGGISSTFIAPTPLNLSAYIAATGASATFTADQITVSTSLAGSVVVLDTFNKGINLATIGVGGMDTGIATSGYVAIYAIYNSSTTTAALLGTLANVAVAPEIYGGVNMPSGYEYSKLISVWPLATSGNFSGGCQIGRTVWFPEITYTPGYALTSWASVNIASSVPISAKFFSGRVAITYPGGVSSALYGLSPLGSTLAQQLFLIANSASAATGGSFTFANMPIVTAQTTFYEVANTAFDSGAAFTVSSYTF